MRTAVKLLKQKKMKAVHAILVVDALETMKTPRMEKLLDFYKTNDGFQCRIIKRENYETLCADSDIALEYTDIGIFGRRLLFLTERYEPEIQGVFIRDQDKIAHYRDHFDKIWDSVSVSIKNPSEAVEQVSLEALFKFDEEQGANACAEVRP